MRWRAIVILERWFHQLASLEAETNCDRIRLMKMGKEPARKSGFSFVVS